jgi:hypothetical protein
MARCIGISKNTGERCRNKALQGKKYCKYHYNRELISRWTISIILSITLFLVSVIFGNDIKNWYLGYKLDIKLNDNIYEEQGNKYVVVELDDIGGYTLHNIGGELDFVCREFNNSLIYGNATLLGPIKTLDIDSEPKPVLFKNEELVKFFSTGRGNCADAILFLKKSKNQMYYYIYYKKTDNVTLKIFNEEEIVYPFCINCDIKINIMSDEKKFSKTIFIDFPALPMIFNSSLHPVNMFGIISLGDDFCVQKVNCQKYLCEKVKNEFDYSINCNQEPLYINFNPRTEMIVAN